MSKFDEAVASLSSALSEDDKIVQLAGNIIRKVRTPEGAAYFGQPIGSVIIADPSGKILKVLHKGSGTVVGSPSTASFENTPDAAKFNANKSTSSADTSKQAKSAFDTKYKAGSAFGAGSAPSSTAGTSSSSKPAAKKKSPAMVYNQSTALEALKEAGLTDSEIEFAEEIATNVDETGMLTKAKWSAEQFGSGAGTVTTSKHQVPRPGNKAWEKLVSPEDGSNLTETSARIRAAVGVLLSANAVTDVDGNLRRTSGKHISENLDSIMEDVGSGMEASYSWFKETFDSKYWKGHQKKQPTVEAPAKPAVDQKADPFANVPKKKFKHPEFGEMSVPFEDGDKAYTFSKGITVMKPDGSAVTVRGDVDKAPFVTKAKTAKNIDLQSTLGPEIFPVGGVKVDKNDKVDWTGKSKNEWDAIYDSLAEGEVKISNVKVGTDKNAKGQVWVRFSLQKGGKIWNLGDGVQGNVLHKGEWVAPGDKVYVNSGSGTTVLVRPDGSGTKTMASGFVKNLSDASSALNGNSDLIHEQPGGTPTSAAEVLAKAEAGDETAAAAVIAAAKKAAADIKAKKADSVDVSKISAGTTSNYVIDNEMVPATYEHPKYGKMSLNVPEGSKVYETGTGVVVERPNGMMFDYKGKSGALNTFGPGEKKLPKSSTKDVTDQIVKTGDASPSQKAQSDALQAAQDAADAAAADAATKKADAKATDAEIEQAKNAIMKGQKVQVGLFGTASGSTSEYAVTGAFVSAAKSGKDQYAFTTTKGWAWDDTKPVQGYRVTPDGQVFSHPEGDAIKFASGAASWKTLLNKHTSPAPTEADKAAAANKVDEKITASVVGATQASVSKQSVDTPAGPIEVHTTPGAKIFTSPYYPAIVQHEAPGYDGTGVYTVKYSAKSGALLNTTVPNNATLVETVPGGAGLGPADGGPIGTVAKKYADSPEGSVGQAYAQGKAPAWAKKFAGKPYTEFWMAAPGMAGGSEREPRLFAIKPDGSAEMFGPNVTDPFASNAEAWPIGAPLTKAYLQKPGNKAFKVEEFVGDEPQEVNEPGELDALIEKLKQAAAGDTSTPATPLGPEPKPVTANSATWPLVLEGTLQKISLYKGDKVWAHAGPTGAYAYYVEKPDGTGISYRLEDMSLKKKTLSEIEMADRKEKVSLTPIDGADNSYQTAQAEPLEESDTKPIKALSSATGIPEDQFSAATVLTPKGKQRVYVAPDAKVMLTGTGAAVAYPGGKTVKYNTVSGKATFASDPNPPHFAEVSIEWDAPSSAPEATSVASAMANVGTAAAGATAALQALQSAAADLNEAKSVSGTKYGTDSNGGKGWLFTTHLGPGGGPVYSDSDEWGNTYLYEVGGAGPVAGPFAQMKEAKAWLSANGTATDNAPEPSAALPEAHEVPDTAGSKMKPAAAAKPAAKKAAAAPKAPVEAEESYFSMGPNDKGQAFVVHPKYGEIAIEGIDPDAKVYTTGVGVVVASGNGSGSVTSGKTGKVEKFDVLPSNKLPASSTVEVKMPTPQTPAQAAESALQDALDTQTQNGISEALNEPYDPYPLVPESFGNMPYINTDTLAPAMAQGALPKFAHQYIHDAQEVWSYIPALSPKIDGWRILVYKGKDGDYHAFNSHGFVPVPMQVATVQSILGDDKYEVKHIFGSPGGDDGLADWEKELLEVTSTPEAKIPDALMATADTSNVLHEALASGHLPPWLSEGLKGMPVKALWLMPTTSDDNHYSLMVEKTNGNSTFYASDSSGDYIDTVIDFSGDSWKGGKEHLLWDNVIDAAIFPDDITNPPEEEDFGELEYGSLGDFPFVDAGTVTEAVEQGALPVWLKPELENAAAVWSFNSASGKSLLVQEKNGNHTAHLATAVPGDSYGTADISSTGAVEIKSISTYNAHLLHDSGDTPPVQVNPVAPDLPASTSETGATVNAENAAPKKVSPEWIKAKKIEDGYEFVGVTDSEGNPVHVYKSAWGDWKSPWGWHSTLKKAKAHAAAKGTIDHSKVKPPTLKKTAPKAAKGVPAGSTLNALGVPEVEWKGHRLPLFPGQRMFEYDNELYVFQGTDGIVVSEDGNRRTAYLTQKQLKSLGEQIAYGGPVGVGSFDFDSLIDKDAEKPSFANVYSYHYNAKVHQYLNSEDFSALGHFIKYLQTSDAVNAKEAKKVIEYADVKMRIRQLNDSDGFDGRSFAVVEAAREKVGVPNTEVRPLREKYSRLMANNLGYDIGSDFDKLDLPQVRDLAASRGFPLGAYISTPEEAKAYVLTEFTGLGMNPNNRSGLLTSLKHQKTLAALAVDSKYGDMLATSKKASGDESAVPQGAALPPEEVRVATLSAMGSLGMSVDPTYSEEYREMALATGSLVAAAAITSNPVESFKALPEATKKAFALRASIYGVEGILKNDFGSDAYWFNTAYTKFAEVSEEYSDFVYKPDVAKMADKYTEKNFDDLISSGSLGSVVSKPEGVSARTWAIVLAALENGETVDGDALPAPETYAGSAKTLHFALGVPPSLVADAPPVVRQLLAYEANTDGVSNLPKALAAVAKTGVWGKGWADTYTTSNGHTLYLRPGDKVYPGHYTVVYNEFSPESSYSVNYSGDYSTLADYQLTEVATKEPAKSVPVEWDYETASSFVTALDKPTYDNTIAALQSGYHEAVDLFPTGGALKGESILAVKAFLSTDEAKNKYPTLSDLGTAAIPDGVLAALHHASINDDPVVPELVEVFGQYGYFAPKEKTNAEIWADELNLNPKAEYFNAISGATNYHQLAFSLNGLPYPMEAYEELAGDLSGKKFGHNEIFGHYDVYDLPSVAEKMWAQLEGSLEKVKAPKADLDELILSPVNKSLGGMHSKKVWVDQHGSEWMSKAFPSDPNGNYRVDVEHYANEIARLYGYNAPATRVMELEGKHQYVQLLAPASGELGSQSWSSMPEDVIFDAMSEHVIDWVVSNHDSHHGNILKTPDGQHAFGIDKGQAGKFFGKDKLAEGYAPNPEPAWYDNVYAAIRTGQMDKAAADKVRDHVLRKAAQVSSRNEDRFMELMVASQKNRVDFPSKYPNAQAWADAHNARRKSTFDDFLNLYKGLYEKAGYEWGSKNAIDDYLPKKVADRLHVAPSEDHAKAVQNNGTLGVPLFYDTGVFADDSMLVYKTKAADGGETLRANATLLPAADQTFMAWLKSHTIEKVHTSPGYNQPVQPAVEKHAKMPLLEDAFPALVNYAKTVNTHAADGEYNSTTVDLAEVAYNNLKDHFEQVTAAAEANPADLVKYKAAQFVTHEQQDTWLAHASRMLQQFENVTKAKSQGVKVSAVADDTPFQMPKYKPSEGLDTSGDPKVVEAYEFNGVVEQKWSDGNYTTTDPQGKVFKSTKGEFAIAANNGEPEPSYITKDAPAEVEEGPEATSSVVSVANVPVTVSYQPASSFAKASADGFDVVESGGVTKFSGHEYQIKVGDITIKYQGLDDHSVARAQRGLARIEIGEWDGTPDAMEKVNELFKSIGLDIDEASEQSLEIGYYRRLQRLANRRKTSAKYLPLRNATVPKTGDQAEVDAWRKILEGVYGKSTMKEFTDSKGWLPHIMEQASGDHAGSSHWLRPDSSVEDFKKWTGGRLPVHSIYNNSHAVGIGTTGLFSTEDRMRVLGEWIGGMSSSTDQTSYGSSEYVYFRQNMGSIPTYGVVLEPDFAMAGSNYAAGHDTFGSTDTKISNAHFDLKGQASHSGGGNELMVKHGVTFFDGIAVMTVPNSSSREAIIKYYKDRGIDEIRGIPVEERVVADAAAAKKTISKVWDLAIEAEKKRKGKVA